MSSPARAKASWRLFGLDGGMHGTWEDYEEERRVGEWQPHSPPISEHLPLCLLVTPPIYPLVMV